MFKRLLTALCLTGMAYGHPLDPLTSQEMESAVTVLKTSGRLTDSTLFPIMTLKEPSKAEVRAYKPGSAVKREAFVVALDRLNNHTYEAVVDLDAKKVAEWKEIPGVQPGVLVEEFESPRAWIKADKRWQEAIAQRGIKDFENVHIDIWAPGIMSEEERRSGKRLLRALSFYRPKGTFNPYFRPIEGVVAVVDVNEKKVVRVDDTGLITPIARNGLGELDEKDVARELGKTRPVVKQIRCMQPGGGGFELDGHHVRWENWDLRFSMHPREGLVLHDVRYKDGDEMRPVLYRGALSEMVVPYGDAASNWSFRNAFDLGEYGVGRLANTLHLGGEVPDYATLLDATFADDFGKAYDLKHCIGIYERDNGILWKHLDFDTGHDETRRARWLYLMYVATVGNYDYALTWVLGQDGSIHVEAQLTGIVLAKGATTAKSAGIDAQGEERFGRLIGPHTLAPNHQHFFNFRLDLDVDGAENCLVESNNEPAPAGPDNPNLNAFSRRITQLKTEGEAMRDLAPAFHRSWMVVNPLRKNALGQNTAYQIVPEETCTPYLQEGSLIRKRAGFLDHQVYGTRFHPEELNASGYYPNQSTISTGLPGWCTDNESLEGQDLVLWYTFGVNHNPRPEEWPVMPAHRTGFKLIPNGFFSRNPALDVPSTASE